MSDRETRCAICDGDMMFEVSSCPDDHDDCPELVCTRCGAAEVVAPIVVHLWLDRPRSSRLPIPLQRAA